MDINEVSRIVYEKCLRAKKSEKALIITDDSAIEIGKSLLDAGEEILSKCFLVETRRQQIHGQEPEDSIAAQMLNYDIIIAPTRFSLTHTQAAQRAAARGARIVTMPGITKDVYMRAIPVDYEELDREGKRRIKALSGNELTVTSPSGTDIYLNIEGREFKNASGLCSEGVVVNLPAGESLIAPLEGLSEGRIAVDVSAAPDAVTKFGRIGKVSKPFFIMVDDGQMVDCGNNVLWKALTSVENGTNLAEFGLGTNPAAKITGNVLEDEKVKGTGHIAFGTNRNLGGVVQSAIHLDVVFSKPTVRVDSGIVIREGRFLSSGF